MRNRLEGMVTLRLTKEQVQLLESYAAALDTDVSEVVRQALARQFENWPPMPPEFRPGAGGKRPGAGRPRKETPPGTRGKKS